MSYATEPRNEGLSAYVILQLNLRLWKVAIPAISSQLVILIVETVSMMFVGRMNDTYAIAGVGLAIIYINVTTTGPLMGLNSAISVLCAVAFGKRDMQECERILQRGRVICFFASIPLFFVAISCKPIFLLMGIEE